MKLYIHVDRGKQLKEGDILNAKEYTKDQHALTLIKSMIDPSFMEHIARMYEQGISYHGYRYLVHPIQNKFSFSEWATEVYFEYVRYKEFPELPSRFQSIFGWKSLEQAIVFDRDSPIFEISNETGFFIADMNLLKMSFNQHSNEETARKYWRGERQNDDLNYVPVWEYIINNPVTVRKQIK